MFESKTNERHAGSIPVLQVPLTQDKGAFLLSCYKKSKESVL